MMAMDTKRLSEPPQTVCPACRVPLMVSKIDTRCPVCGWRDRSCKTCG